VSRKVGHGLHTFFWYDRWVGNVPLRKRFPRLFDLSSNKLATVEEMFTLGWSDGGEAWKWKCRLWTWEEDMVVECRLLHDGFVLYSDISDRWQWDPDISKGYTVSGAYQILTSQAATSSDVLGDLVWHKQVPLKVLILAWRLLQDRLPTINNLVRRDII